MIKKLNTTFEISLLLEATEGVTIYLNDDELPSHNVSIESLIDEWVDAHSVAQSIAPEHVQEAQTLILHLYEAIETINNYLLK